MTRKSKARRTAVVSGVRPVLSIVLLSLSGCFSLSRGGPAQEHYVLGGGVPKPAEEGRGLSEQAVSRIFVGLRPVRLAAYLASPFIVVRHGIHRIGFSEFHRWGEDLSRGINQALVEQMNVESSGHRVESAPWAPGRQPEYLVQLHLLRFEGVASMDSTDGMGEAHLLATWEILRAGDGTVLQFGTTEVRSPGWVVGDFDRLVGLLEAGLSALADDLIRGLEQVARPDPQPSYP
jgi:uncharacterized lipoprotein YmbA